MDYIGHGVIKSQTRLSDFHFKAPLAVLNRCLGFITNDHAEHFLPIKYVFVAVLEMKNTVRPFSALS